MNLMKSVRTAAMVVLMLTASVANAGLYGFTITGDYSASWQMDSNAVPDVGEPGLGIFYMDVEGNFPGSLFDVADLTFYSGDLGGGLEIYDFYGGGFTLLITDGEQLYSGLESSPMFRLGTFGLTDFQGSGTYTLTVTDLDAGPEPSPVPEPATSAMLLGGLSMLYAVRKRRYGK